MLKLLKEMSEVDWTFNGVDELDGDFFNLRMGGITSCIYRKSLSL